ncbi:MAG: hypothetical protein KDD55_13685, partial [Bdellovibrionales bacterium]|nr:hypothetical protein [Bdellovibrionales bacterium]
GTPAPTTPPQRLAIPPLGNEASGDISVQRNGAHLEAIPSQSLGQTVLEAHGFSRDERKIVLCNSYVTGAFQEGTLPTNLLPEPSGDAYLVFTAAPTLMPGETLVSLTFQPGVLDYYRSIGLLSPEASIIEVNPDPQCVSQAGFPFTDPISQLPEGDSRLTGSYFISTFPSEVARQRSSSLGSASVQNYDPAYLNNKAQFRIDAPEYGYRMLPGIVCQSPEDLLQVTQFQGTKLWAKLATGSGGDLVQPVYPNEGALESALTQLRNAVHSAFSNAQFPHEASGEAFWPSHALTPSAERVVIEQDAAVLGPILLNGSMNVCLHRDGTFELVDYFRQNTAPDGSYRGSERFHPEDLSHAVHEAIDEQAQQVFAYAHDHGYRGYIGFDFFVLGSQDNPTVYCIELNARPTMSTVPALTAKKMQSLSGGESRYDDYINVNIEAPFPLETISDIQRALSIHG